MAEEIGCQNLTLHKLANRLNIKPASLYTHISGIEQLYVLLSDLALKQLGTSMMDAVKDKNGVKQSGPYPLLIVTTQSRTRKCTV